MSLSILAAMLAAIAADRWWKALIYGITAALAVRLGLLWYFDAAGPHMAQMAIADALAKSAMAAAVISPIAYFFATGRSRAYDDSQQVKPTPSPGRWRSPSNSAPLIGKHLGWSAWLSIAIGISVLIAFLAFTPGARDRWVKKDGAMACQGAAEIEDIQSSQSASSLRFTIEDLVAEGKCVPLFADDRVRIREIGDDGSKVRVVLGTSRQSMWMQLENLKPKSPTLLTTPWLWEDLLATASALDEKAKNPFDQFHTSSAEAEEKRSVVDTPARQDSKFAAFKLPRGVVLHVPTGWRLLGNDLRLPAETAVEADIDLSTIELPEAREVNLIAAYSLPAHTYAALRIDSAIPPSVSPAEVATLGIIDLSEMSREFVPHLEKQMQLQGNRLIEYVGTRSDRISGHPTIVTEYRRSGPKGSVFVQVNQIITETHEISVNLSYRESEAAIWKPVIEKVRQSIVITKWP